MRTASDGSRGATATAGSWLLSTNDDDDLFYLFNLGSRGAAAPRGSHNKPVFASTHLLHGAAAGEGEWLPAFGRMRHTVGTSQIRKLV